MTHVYVFFFPAKNIYFLFIYLLSASPEWELKHTVEGLDVLVTPGRFIFCKGEAPTGERETGKWVYDPPVA